MVKAKWVDEPEDTDEAWEIFAKLFIDELERWAGKVLIYICMSKLLRIAQNG